MSKMEMSSGEKPPISEISDAEREKVAIIENIPIDISEKVELVLLLAGKKSAASIHLYSESWDVGSIPKKVDLQKVASILEDLKMIGFAAGEIKRIVPIQRLKAESIGKEQLKPEDYDDKECEYVDIDVALNEETLEKIQKACAVMDDYVMGTLYGFPKTAIAAYMNDHDISEEADLPEDIRKNEAFAFYTFALSRNNYRDDFETIISWAATVKRYSPKIYREKIEDEKKWSFTQ